MLIGINSVTLRTKLGDNTYRHGNYWTKQSKTIVFCYIARLSLNRMNTVIG